MLIEGQSGFDLGVDFYKWDKKLQKHRKPYWWEDAIGIIIFFIIFGFMAYVNMNY